MIEERSLDQGYNGVKYLLTIIAVCLRTAYGFESEIKIDPTSPLIMPKNPTLNPKLKVLAGASSVLAAVFCTYWDFVHDWGLLNRRSKNRWLRDKLLVPQKKVYFIAMVSAFKLPSILCNVQSIEKQLNSWEKKTADLERCVEIRVAANGTEFRIQVHAQTDNDCCYGLS